MYKPSKFTYGNKTTEQIESISGRTAADTVYDTNRYKRDFFNGYINLNHDMIALTANTNISIGLGVRMDTTNNNVRLSNNTAILIGMAVRTATTGNIMAIAVGGIYPVWFIGSSVRSRFAVPGSNGIFTDSSTGAVTDSGTLLQTGAATGLLNTLIAPCEKI